MASNETISKAEAARRWGLSKAAVTKYVHKGMPVRDDGRLDWWGVDSWRKRYVGEEPSSPRFARTQAKPNRVTPRAPGPEEQATEDARQIGRWEVHRALTGPAAMERTIKVLLRLGLTPKHAFYAAFWLYLSLSESDDSTELDFSGPGAILEPDWKKLFPRGAEHFDFDEMGERVAMT